MKKRSNRGLDSQWILLPVSLPLTLNTCMTLSSCPPWASPDRISTGGMLRHAKQRAMQKHVFPDRPASLGHQLNPVYSIVHNISSDYTPSPLLWSPLSSILFFWLYFPFIISYFNCTDRPESTFLFYIFSSGKSELFLNPKFPLSLCSNVVHRFYQFVWNPW
jgi:hypothetical protein